MKRFEFFDQKTITKEFKKLPTEDATRLLKAMNRYEQDDEAGFTHKDYGDGIEMLKVGQAQGRCIFFQKGTEARDGEEITILTVLMIYKKETQELPSGLIEKVTARRNRFLEE